jgi:hypothetical protein
MCGVASGGVTQGSDCGQRTDIVLKPQGSNPHEFKLTGQVGEESHRRPAVVKHAARCPKSSKNVLPVVSFVVSATCAQAQGEDHSSNWNAQFRLVTS